MRILRLQATNLGSWADLDFTVPDGVTALVGANGAGKTTLLSVADLALYAKKGELVKCLRDGEQQVEVVCEFEVRGETYRVRRGAGRKSYLDFEREWRSGSPDGPQDVGREPLTCASQEETQAAIEQTVGLNRDTFRASAYLGQNAASFAEANPAQRMELFSALLGLGDYERLATLAHDQLAEVKRELDRIGGRLESLDAQAADRPDAEALVADAAQRVERAAAAALTAQQAYDAAVESYRDAQALTQTVDTARANLAAAELEHGRLAMITASAEKAQADLAALASSTSDLSEMASCLPHDLEREAELRAAVEAHARLVSEHAAAVRAQGDAADRVASLERRAETHDSRADVLDGLREETFAGERKTCRECGQELGHDASIHAAARIAEQMDVEREKAEQCRAESRAIEIPIVGEPPAGEPPTEALAQASRAVEAARTAERDLATLNERAAGLERTVALDDEDHKVRVATASEERERATAALTTALGAAPSREEGQRQQQRIADIREALNAAQTDERWATADQGRAEQRLATAVAAIEQATTLRDEQETLLLRADVLARCEQAHGRTGIPALILENRSAGIEHDATRILQQLGGESAGARVELRTLRETKAGTQQARLDVNIVTIDGHDRPFGRWSGGEKMRVDFALRWAVAANLGLRFLILDEPAAALDDDGKAAFLAIVEFLSERLDSVLLVSHTPELRDSLPQTVEIRRDNGGPSILVSSEVVEGALA